MNKKIMAFVIVVLLAMSMIVYVKQSLGIDDTAPADPGQYAFAQFKKSCTVFDEEAADKRIYTNARFGFTFKYPANTVVCERVSPAHMETGGYEVSIWKKDAFMSETPQSPLLIMHIDDPDIENLPEPRVVSQTRIHIGGQIATSKQERSSFCTDDSCKTFTIIEFSHGPHDFVIEQWEQVDGFIESFMFLQI